MKMDREKFKNRICGNIKEVTESTEDTLSRTLRYLLRLGITIPKTKFADLISKKENEKIEET